MLKKVSMLLMFVLLLTLAGCEPTEKRTGNQGEVKDVTGQKNPVTTVVKDPNPLTKEYVVYRVQKNGEEILIPEKVRYAAGKKSREEAALDALLHTDPVSKQLTNLFPPGTDVLSVKVNGDTVTVDFNQNFASRGQGSYTERMMVNAVVCTLTEFPEIKKVKFLVEGKEIYSISGHMDLLDPLTRNPDVLKKPDKEQKSDKAKKEK
jgi:spore germination protein GerM